MKKKNRKSASLPCPFNGRKGITRGATQQGLLGLVGNFREANINFTFKGNNNDVRYVKEI
jgi:hypothetical protein